MNRKRIYNIVKLIEIDQATVALQKQEPIYIFYIYTICIHFIFFVMVYWQKAKNNGANANGKMKPTIAAYFMEP